MLSDKVIYIDSSKNVVIAHFLERGFPGILIQGDSFKIIIDDLTEIYEDVTNKNFDDVAENLEYLLNRLNENLSFYEKTLDKAKMDLPYIRK